MEPRKTRRTINRKKRLIVLSLLAAVICFGLWFTTTNAYKFARGYLAFKTMDTEEPAAASVSKSKDSLTADSSAEASSVEAKKRYTLVLLARKKSRKCQMCLTRNSQKSVI